MIRCLIKAVVLLYIDKKNKIMDTKEKALIVSFGLWTTGEFDAIFLVSIVIMKFFFKILRNKGYISNYLIAKVLLIYSVFVHYLFIYNQ
jgi:uncharacterized membrane protein YobD (UPF0266 family)